MSLNGSMPLKNAAGHLIATLVDTLAPAGFNGGTPLVDDCRISVTSATTGLWPNAGLSYDTAGRLAIGSGPAVNWVGGIPLDSFGRVFVEAAAPMFYAQGGVPITAAGAVAMTLSSTPSDLFANGEEGLWYDPSDQRTMFQDAEGTIPVTGVGQPVKLIMDKSGNGNDGILLSGNVTLQQDELGLYYLDLDGSSGLKTVAPVNFTGTDRLTVWAGLRRSVATLLSRV